MKHWGRGKYIVHSSKDSENVSIREHVIFVNNLKYTECFHCNFSQSLTLQTGNSNGYISGDANIQLRSLITSDTRKQNIKQMHNHDSCFMYSPLFFLSLIMFTLEFRTLSVSHDLLSNGYTCRNMYSNKHKFLPSCWYQ